MMRTALIASPLLMLLVMSAPAWASDRYCKHEQPRQLTLDIGDARTVVFEVGPHDLTVESRRGASAAMNGRACSSHADRLANLKVEQRRAGDKLIVRMYQEGKFGGISFGSNYAYLNLTATLPDDLPVQVKVGSGEANVTGAPVFSADVGSGHAVGRSIRGLAAVSVGSGDVDIHGASSLKVVSIGSGMWRPTTSRARPAWAASARAASTCRAAAASRSARSVPAAPNCATSPAMWWSARWAPVASRCAMSAAD
jgi:hypothetical protein